MRDNLLVMMLLASVGCFVLTPFVILLGWFPVTLMAAGALTALWSFARLSS